MAKCIMIERYLMLIDTAFQSNHSLANGLTQKKNPLANGLNFFELSSNCLIFDLSKFQSEVSFETSVTFKIDKEFYFTQKTGSSMLLSLFSLGTILFGPWYPKKNN
jgi:hypothetical protein